MLPTGSRFNPRARVGRDGCRKVAHPACLGVSIHAPAWGATRALSASARTNKKFQSTRPRGARPGSWYWHTRQVPFQSTRPRGARPRGCGGRRSAHAVSIHAPAWGATRPWSGLHAWSRRFNPRARVGRDCPRQGERVGRVDVSIHAPAWGATIDFSPMAATLWCFNPRARVGRDTWSPVCDLARGVFQSTRPRGARPGRAADTPQVVSVSIHAPAWGATQHRFKHGSIVAVSIHAPAWGATLIEVAPLQGSLSFNPRARVGRDYSSTLSVH